VHDRLTGEAAQWGLEWHLDKAKPGNTFDAHRLLLFAQEHGHGEAMQERLFRAYLSEGVAVSNHDELKRLGDDVGLTGVRELLASDRFAVDVRADEERAMELGFSASPPCSLTGALSSRVRRVPTTTSRVCAALGPRRQKDA
jgi:predicted DsbA family dithiol-disulfide isomerase